MMGAGLLQMDVYQFFSLLGVVQCVYVLVYMLFRAGDVRRAVLPFLYFLALGAAFFLDFGERLIGELSENYHLWQWAAWAATPPLAVLLVIQIARITKAPALRDYWVLLLLPAAYFLATSMAQRHGAESEADWLTIAGLCAGAASIGAIWMKRGILGNIDESGMGKERFWLVVTIVFANLCFLGVMLLSLTSVLGQEETTVIHSVLGLLIAYLAGTSLFRIYPQAVLIVERKQRAQNLTGEEQGLAERIRSLIDLEKVYHEPSYSRSSLAQELGVSEAVVSRIVNHSFGKSLPQLLNERRVEDAKRLLLETDAPIQTVARECGFNSIVSFNRAFRELTGSAPGAFRQETKQTG